MPNDTLIMLSVAPAYAERIIAGSKSVELRRRAPRIANGTRAWLYSTLPVGEVRALLTIETVVEASVDEIWRRFGSRAQISKHDFDAYFSGLEVGAALIIRDVSALKMPVSLGELRKEGTFQPPQFYRRVKSNTPEYGLGLRERHPAHLMAST